MNIDKELLLNFILKEGLYKELPLTKLKNNWDILALFLGKRSLRTINNEIINYSQGSEKFALIYPIETINIYCQECNRETTYEVLTNNLDSSFIKFIEEFNSYTKAIYEGFLDQNEIQYSKANIYHKLVYHPFPITTTYVCAHSKNKLQKHLFSINYKFTQTGVIKIGQYPSLNDITGLDLKKYKKINNDIFLELNKAKGLFSHGIGVGSYAYLRRIIEKYIVNKKHIDHLIKIGKTLEESESLTKSTYFKEKVTTIKYELSDLLHGNDKIYGFLSKGIHGLSEDECLEVFPILFDSICIVLDEEIERKEKEKKKRELASKLNKLK